MGCTGSKQKGKAPPILNSAISASLSSLGSDDKHADDGKSILAESVIHTLLNKTKFTQQEIVDWWHGFLSDCPSGLLDKKKFVEVYQHRYPNGKAKRFCDHVFRTFNPDKKTRAIDFERFMRAIDVTLNGSIDEKLEWAFIMYDVNGDQRISKSEMIDVVESMFDLLAKDKKGRNNPKKHIEQIFSRIDSDRDNYVSKEEFMNGCKTDEQIRAILAPHYWCISTHSLSSLLSLVFFCKPKVDEK